MKRHLSTPEIQNRLASDLRENKVVLIRKGETLHREPDGSVWRTVNEKKEKLDDKDVRAFLKIAANFLRKQILAQEGR